ncbi:ATP-binding cassette domain-containing protein [Acidocella aminolytica]|jgi:simple sugar transport system ATP-binding protein|uniref:ABC transporter n=1 Tax=Acidocella aminolytica 101 = DSM 11237 TaxID=1120923 RepID=A0A0D6PFI7_9PROT|nr:ATP-binding cassette domain-containing protein [Acidocella aminolytica]GAN80525.1 ABC transporter [Acidocella aminolytica 101 = DSM 11237]GBQ37766.1 sugar ABC transporter ATP-binding protein [Acidocella aminolytica 101 = DSM 11237]SHF39885.1 monosaccharide ABC transporter ATP-binding protein, CUT2 family [Acidocella aminolytica 101 = DSM 11237]
MENHSNPIIQLTDVGKSYGNIRALSGISLSVRRGEVTCVLGDNGAGKSSLISIIAGLRAHDEGTYAVDGEAVKFTSPRQALNLGISAVYQTLALVPLLPIWRNFFLGSELTAGSGLFKRLNVKEMYDIAQTELRRMGINVADLNQPVGTLSGGQRQVVAIARAIYFGARVLILDEPTAALGVAQSGLVLRYIARAAREHGTGVIFITHNPHHAYMVGDHFIVLSRGRVELDAPRSQLSLENLMFHMAGGGDLETLKHELSRAPAGNANEAAAAPG